MCINFKDTSASPVIHPITCHGNIAIYVSLSIRS